jgi:predicted permease
MDVLARVIPFFLLIGVGALAARVRVIDMAAARALSAYVFWIAFPALLIHSLATMAPPDAGLWAALGLYGVGVAAPLALPVLAGRALGWDRKTRGGAAMAAISGNTAFLGAPLAVSLFGAAAGEPAGAMVAVDCTLIMALATAFVRAGAEDISLLGAAAKTLRNPLVVAALIGAGLCLARVALPAPIGSALAMLRATASPVGLVALGAVMGLEAGRPSRRDSAAIGLALAGKLALAPLLVWLLMSGFGAEPTVTAAATLLAACPSAVNVFIQTRAYGAFERGGALAVIVSTLAAAITLPLIGALVAT